VTAALAPIPTRCRNCGTTAAEVVCHICKQPKYLLTSAQRQEPAAEQITSLAEIAAAVEAARRVA